MESKKGLFAQIREIEPEDFRKIDFDEILKKLETSTKEDDERRNKWIKSREENRKKLIKKSKELGKEIPFELAFHTYLSSHQTYVGSDFLVKYKEWLY